MNIGLTSEQLYNIIIELFITHYNRITAEKLTADINLNPNLSKFLKMFREQYPIVT